MFGKEQGRSFHCEGNVFTKCIYCQEEFSTICSPGRLWPTEAPSSLVSCLFRKSSRSVSRMRVSPPTLTTFSPFSAVQRQTVDRLTFSIAWTSESVKKRSITTATFLRRLRRSSRLATLATQTTQDFRPC